MFLIWHGSIVRAPNRISSKFPLGLLGKLWLNNCNLSLWGKIHGPAGLGCLASRRLSPLDAWQRPSAAVRGGVGERGWTSSHPRRTSPRPKSYPVGASSAHRRIRIFETSHYRLHSDAESWWHTIKKSSRQFERVAQTCLVVTLRRFLSTIPFTEQDTHYLFMRSAPRPSSRPWHQAGHLAHLQTDDCI